jgi:hypothetical protein
MTDQELDDVAHVVDAEYNAGFQFGFWVGVIGGFSACALLFAAVSIVVGVKP